jgi:hypothetical protein
MFYPDFTWSWAIRHFAAAGFSCMQVLLIVHDNAYRDAVWPGLVVLSVLLLYKQCR